MTNYIKSSNGTISGFIVVNNATLQDAGTYEARLVWNYRNPCYHYYSSLLIILNSQSIFYYYGGIFEELIVARSSLKLSYAGKRVSFRIHLDSMNASSMPLESSAPCLGNNIVMSGSNVQLCELEHYCCE